MAWTSHGNGVLSKPGPNGKPVYYARVTVNGRQHVARAGKTLAQAVKLRGTLLNEIDNARAAGREWVPPAEKRRRERAAARRRLTFTEFSIVFLRDHAAGKRRRKWFEDQTRVLVRRFGKKRLDEITAHDVASYRASEAGRLTPGGKPLRAQTVNHRLAFLRLMLSRAVAWGYLVENVAAKVEFLKTTAPLERYFTADETADIISRIGTRSRPVVQLALLTGMRRGELLGLVWSRVKLDQRKLYLPVTKNGRARWVPLNDDAVTLLRAIPEHTTTDRVFCHRGAPLTEKEIRDDWDDLGITGRFHDLRHTWASRQVAAGCDLYLLMKLGGWSSYGMVQRYAHFVPEALHRAAELVAGTAQVTPQVTPSSAPSAPPLPAIA